jgi:hypothetical protein
MTATDEMEDAFADATAALDTCLDALDAARAHHEFRSALKAHPGAQAGWARQHGVSATYVSDVLHGRREISETIAAALGLHRMTIFVRANQGEQP